VDWTVEVPLVLRKVGNVQTAPRTPDTPSARSRCAELRRVKSPLCSLGKSHWGDASCKLCWRTQQRRSRALFHLWPEDG